MTWEEIVARAAPAWQMLNEDERERVWTEFDTRFGFRASMDPEDWPGIREPTASRTYAIGHVFGEAQRYDRLTIDLSNKLRRALQACVSPTTAVLVLEWQGPAYRFWPHEPFEYAEEDAWPVPVLPNGDYYIFLAEDFSFGVVGHPWEHTMCVFGAALLAAIDEEMPELFGAPVRVGGHDAAPDAGPARNG